MSIPTSRSQTRGRRFLIILAVLITGLGLTSSPASAAEIDNIVPTANYSEGCHDGIGGTLCQTDNGDVYYYMDSNLKYELESPDRAAVTDMLSSQYSPTDLAIHYDSNPTFDGAGETDVIWQEGSDDLPDDAIGMTWCDDDSPDGYACDQQYIRIQGNGTYDGSVTCHEMGHAVGLTHGEQASPQVGQEDPRLGCMIASGWNDELGSNNVSNINDVYTKP